MKCPNGKHDNYCPEEDSVWNPNTETCECAACVREERDALLALVTKMAKVLGDLRPLGERHYKDQWCEEFNNLEKVLEEHDELLKAQGHKAKG